MVWPSKEAEGKKIQTHLSVTLRAHLLSCSILFSLHL